MEESTAHNSVVKFPSSASGSLDDEMNVYLKIVKTVAMKIKGSDMIATLKAKVNRKEGISAINQKLFLDGEHLPDTLRIVDSGIQNNASTLNLIFMDSVAINLFINIQPDNGIMILETKTCETVHNIKLMIQEKKGFDLPNSFTLFYNGKLLEEKSILNSVGIRNNSTIHLISSKKLDVVTLFVKAHGTVEAVKLSVKVLFTVGDVKAIVMSMIGKAFSNGMSLYYDGQVLDDSKTLAFYDVEEGSQLDLLSTAMQIFVKTWTGETLTLMVSEHHTAKDIIVKISQKLQKTITDNKLNFYLVYAGKQLDDDKDVASYKIQRHSTLFAVTRRLSCNACGTPEIKL